MNDVDTTPGSEIKEYEDRWVLRPMRGGRVVRTSWHPERIEFAMDTPFRIVVGYGAEMAHGSIAEDAPTRHAISHWTKVEVAQMVSAPVLSSVLFKSGSLRIAFGNGWQLFVSDRHPDVSATVFFGDAPMWDRSGMVGQAGFPVVAIDPWTGRRIDAPPWPPRPPDLDFSNGSDDING
ncbi:hypothetical protein [Nocardia amikacinitolerans]|uniref:hypothetical protein n=1 Tax=Nocardia amikacinitolerans TaxID=756689 RepID=UPI0020A267FE|nr:hypothetical protein [Nocardia amikacinitolerans]